MDDFKINVSVRFAADTAEEYVKNSGISVNLIDRYDMGGNGVNSVTMIFEKYFMRNSSRASLTVTINDLDGITHVHAVGSGGGQDALFKFDWGASRSFEGSVRDALKEYII